MPMIDNDELLFKRAEKAILSHKLYLREDHTGMGFPRYINSLRMERASKMLIENPDFTIESIATDCGMPVAQTFYRLFMAQFGVTPTEYRRQHAK